MKSKHIVFVGGGTLGHIAPILAVMDAVKAKAPSTKCTFVCQPQDVSSPLIKDSKLDFDVRTVESGKLHRHISGNHLKQLGKLIKGIGEARKLIKELQPDVIFAKGGYTTVPVVLAAARKKIPVYCHESDAVPGLANRFVARYAETIFTTYPVGVYKALPKSRIVQTGQPVRDMFYVKATQLPLIDGAQLNPNVPVITVIGGSQGAARINELMIGAWESLLHDYQIVHITGQNQFAEVANKANKLNQFQRPNLHLVPLLTNELPALFQKSVVVVSRSGGTVSELAASRACSLLIPLSTAAQNHQEANARALEGMGAAHVLIETKTNSEELVLEITDIAGNVSEQTSLRAAIGRFDFPDASMRMADYLLK